MAKGTKIEVVKGFWAGVKGTAVTLSGNQVQMTPDGEGDMIGTFTLDEIQAVA